MHDPKLDPGQMVGYLVDPTPSRHTTAGFNKYDVLRLWERVEWAPESPLSFSKDERYLPTPEHGLYIAACSMYKMVIDGAGVCTFGADMGADRFQLFEYLNAATGWEKSPEEYMEMGRRVHSLRQWFNIREGLMPAKVEVSGRLYGNPPLNKGPLKGITLDLKSLRQHYWAAIGWDQQSGYPPIESLVEVGLEERQRL
jgi:aldehyde:ferredoxin oxidoreductase